MTKSRVAETEVGRYFVDVAYTYHVSSDQFTGSRVRASDGEYNIRDGAVQAIRGLTVGQTVAVYYKPTDPRQAVLKPGAGFQEYVLLFVPIAMFGFGIWSLRLLYRTRQRA